MGNKNSKQNKAEDFSIVLGGPLYKFYLNSNLLERPINLFWRRIIIVTMFTWLPLLILATICGVVSKGVKIPFIFDLDIHARFIGALGLLIAAEVVAHQRIRDTVLQFTERDILIPESKTKFKSYIASAIKWRNSPVVEILLLITVLLCGQSFWRLHSSLSGSTWYATLVNGKPELNLAGYWYIFISLPVFQFVFIRWYFRVFIWYKLLWQISRLPLCLNSLHPDRAGGLSFLTMSIFAFSPFILAHTVLLSGLITNRIWHEKAVLVDFKLEVLGLISFLLVVTFSPLLFFLFPMARAKRLGNNKYGVMASHFVNAFRGKWIDRKSERTVIVNEEVQSLADLSNGFQASRDMNIIPFTMHNIIQILVIALLPLAPLIFTMIPVAEVIRGVARIFI